MQDGEIDRLRLLWAFLIKNALEKKDVRPEKKMCAAANRGGLPEALGPFLTPCQSLMREFTLISHGERK